MTDASLWIIDDDESIRWVLERPSQTVVIECALFLTALHFSANLNRVSRVW